MSIELRQATAGDASVIHQMICELASYEREASSVRVTLSDLQRQLAMENPPFRCLIAETKNGACGFALYFYAYSTWEGTRTLYLEDLFVRPQFRGEKVGLALMRRLAQIAQQENCGRFEWSVLDWNEPAVNFYERLGAQPMSGWTRYRMDAQNIASLVSA